jgi:LuxR family maltose regulon positive regulatory protein
VLDDYHLVRAASIHAAIAFLLEHLPRDVHLVLATREDPPLPLPRLRARGQLAEVRVADLQFTPEEGAQFLAASMGLRLADEQVAVLIARTEGWVAGLQLAALALRDRPDPAAFLAAFAGSHRLVADYLTSEVIDRQPATLRRFLLTTSVLNRLCAPLCDALLGATKDERPMTKDDIDGPFVLRPSALVSDSDSQAVLEELERANLFLVPLDDERRWYRYHHLLADALGARLRREIGQAGVVDLYRRAYLWHEQHDLPEEAVNYALAARDWPSASKLLERLTTSLTASSRLIVSWIESLPSEEVKQSPELSMWYASWLILGGEFGEVDRLLDAAERAARSASQYPRLGGVYASRAMAAFLREDGQATVEYAGQAMLSVGDENPLVYISMSEALARGHYLAGELANAERIWTETLPIAQAANSQRTLLFIRAAQGELQYAKGRLRQAAQLDRDLMKQIGEIPADVLKIRTFSRLAKIYYEWNQLDEAEQYLQQAFEVVGQSRRDVFTRSACLILAQIYWARDNLEQASEPIERANVLAQRMGGDYPMSEVEAHQVRMWLAQGAQAPALAWAETQYFDPDGELRYQDRHTHLALCRVWMAQNQADQAIRMLERLLAAAEAAGRHGQMVEMLMLKALAHQASYQESHAFTSLIQALTLAEPEGYVRTFVDEGHPMAQLLSALRQRPSAVSSAYLDTLLAAFPNFESAFMDFGLEVPALQNPKSTIQTLAEPLSTRQEDRALHTPHSTIQNLVEPLSKREQEILALLAVGLTNAEIAQHMIISPQTVKVHTRNIYGKLEVSGRRQAVIKAKALGLLV